ncbi:hypothetical protein Q0M94_24285 (plasmid) [Deinococcus radiomollis]|uniref:hypothetical protein n=1 Tax=Deinococcus radiomollis TaxID=468916 RepID=UPI003891D7B2
MLIFLLGVVVVAVLAWLLLRRARNTPNVSAPAPSQSAPPTALIDAPPAPPETIPVDTGQVYPATPTVLDEHDAERREIDTATLQHARSAVTSAVPDAVLADALQHTDATYLAHAFAGVDAAVLAAAIGEAPRQTEQTVRPEDRKALIGVETAVDDLDIWSFGES